MPTLLSLPRELRDHILAHLLLKTQNTITMLSNAHCFASEISAAQPTVASVCKQLRCESLPTFYNSNVFLAELSHAEDLDTARNWLDAIGDENVHHLRHLVLSGWTRTETCDQLTHLFVRGHRRYVRMAFDLREGTIMLEDDRGVETPTPTPIVMWDIGALQQSFEEMINARRKRGEQKFGVAEVRELMDGFHRICLVD